MKTMRVATAMSQRRLLIRASAQINKSEHVRHGVLSPTIELEYKRQNLNTPSALKLAEREEKKTKEEEEEGEEGGVKKKALRCLRPRLLLFLPCAADVERVARAR